MSQCRQIESLLPPYVDGEAGPGEVTQVETHLATCAECRALAAAQRTVRTVLRSHAAELATTAPPGLRTRILASRSDGGAASLGWRGRLAASLAAAVLFVMLVFAFELVSPRSNILYAAQLAIDHVRCFVVELGTVEGADSARAQQFYAETYGWKVAVPPSNAEAGVTLVAARRCPYWLGDHAHLLYRSGDSEVSLFINRGDERPSDELRVFGHIERLWHVGDTSYALVARGVPAADLARISGYLEGVTGRPVQP